MVTASLALIRNCTYRIIFFTFLWPFLFRVFFTSKSNVASLSFIALHSTSFFEHQPEIFVQRKTGIQVSHLFSYKGRLWRQVFCLTGMIYTPYSKLRHPDRSLLKDHTAFEGRAGTGTVTKLTKHQHMENHWQPFVGLAMDKKLRGVKGWNLPLRPQTPHMNYHHSEPPQFSCAPVNSLWMFRWGFLTSLLR